MEGRDPEKVVHQEDGAPAEPRRSSEALPAADVRRPLQPPAEDVHIPLQLLQATGHIGNHRDERSSLSWEPQPAFPSFSGSAGESVVRRGTQITLANEVAHESAAPTNDGAMPKEKNAASPFTDLEHPTGPYMHRQLSYVPGSDDVLTTARNSRTSRLHLSSSSFWSTTDPFATGNNSIAGDTPLQSHSELGLHTADPEAANVEAEPHARRGTLASVVDALVPDVIQRRFTDASYVRRSSLWQTYETAKRRGKELQRNKYAQIVFEYCIYAFLILFVYFVLVGRPLWNGTVWWLWWVVANKFVLPGGFGIVLGIALFYAFGPLLILFEKDPPPADGTNDAMESSNVQETALLIPCYKSAGLIAATLESALKIFPASHIYVIANGNSPTPLDNTEEVCRPYGVNHIWSPIGSKIVAQFVGCYAAKAFKNVLLIDDDCALPDNFPVVTDRLVGKVLCVGYTIKSVGPNSSKGNLCQQAQDLEYKLSGIQREFAGKIGSATFPHGAISLWDREMLVKTFHEHPGFSVSEDWFFGHVARQLGCRIKMCSQVFVETETPTAVFRSGGGSRGGFGEMTIFSQRFKRWNFFFVNGMYYDMAYIFCNWKLGWWEFGAKIFVFQEVYETLLYLLTPFILPISFVVRPSFCGILLGATIVLYLINVIVFNEIHLRRKNERLGWKLLYIYYLPYKIVLTGINVASCYWSMWKYAKYFAKRHPKVTEDEKAVEVVIRLEEEASSKEAGGLGRSLTVRTVGTASRRSVVAVEGEEAVSPLHVITSNTSPLFCIQEGIVNIARPEPAHLEAPKMSTPQMAREGIAGQDYFFTPRTRSLEHPRVQRAGEV